VAQMFLNQPVYASVVALQKRPAANANVGQKMTRKHKKDAAPYRPNMGAAFKPVFQAIAAELNKTSLYEFDELAAARHAPYELWRIMFPDTPFPPDADVLRMPYHKDPNKKE